MHCCIKIAHIPCDERVIAAHFQRQHLARLAGELPMQQGACLVAAGEQDAVEVRMRCQRGAGVTRAVDQIDDAIRQPGLHPQLHRPDGGLGRVLAGLEHDGIACDQGRHDVAVRQMTREVIRAEDGEYAMRAVAQHRIAVRNL